MPDTQTTAALDVLPPLAEAMTAADLAAHESALRLSMGGRGEAYFRIRNEGASLGLYPCGISSSGINKTVYGDNWPEVISAARAWIATHATVHRDNRIRAMALAIIDLTDQFGRCDRAMLTRRDFTDAEIDDLKDAACQRAGELAGNAPFEVLS